MSVYLQKSKGTSKCHFLVCRPHQTRWRRPKRCLNKGILIVRKNSRGSTVKRLNWYNQPIDQDLICTNNVYIHKPCFVLFSRFSSNGLQQIAHTQGPRPFEPCNILDELIEVEPLSDEQFEYNDKKNDYVNTQTTL